MNSVKVKKTDRGRMAKYFLSWVMLTLSVTAVIKAPSVCRSSVTNGLMICVRSVIPSIFPFAVISSLMSRIEPPSFVSRPLSKIFGISSAGSGAVVTGLVSGFPSGSICAVKLLKDGSVSREEAERLICFTNNPSAAFLVGGVGAVCLNSAEAGVMLYVFQLIVSVAVGVFLGKGKRGSVCVTHSGRSLSGADVALSVRDAAGSVLTVSSFVVAFSVICGYFNAITESETLRCIVGGILEISNGTAFLASFPADIKARYILAGAFCGWSGLSVHFQVASFVCDQGVGMKKYYISKLFSALAMALLCALGASYVF